jgi:adenylosuccinate synthase
VLTGLDPLKICVGYDFKGTRYDDFPAALQVLRGLEPIYEEHPGWKESTVGVKKYADLPANARAYLERLQALVGAPMAIISTGPDRAETIVLRHPFE